MLHRCAYEGRLRLMCRGHCDEPSKADHPNAHKVPISRANNTLAQTIIDAVVGTLFIVRTFLNAIARPVSPACISERYERLPAQASACCALEYETQYLYAKHDRAEQDVVQATLLDDRYPFCFEDLCNPLRSAPQCTSRPSNVAFVIVFILSKIVQWHSFLTVVVLIIRSRVANASQEPADRLYREREAEEDDGGRE